MVSPPPVPPLPLSQQILAWAIGAMGHAHGPTGTVGVSRQTLKNAARGHVITQSWAQLTEWVLHVAGVAVSDDRIHAVQDLCDAWDRRVGELQGRPV